MPASGSGPCQHTSAGSVTGDLPTATVAPSVSAPSPSSAAEGVPATSAPIVQDDAGAEVASSSPQDSPVTVEATPSGSQVPAGGPEAAVPPTSIADPPTAIPPGAPPVALQETEAAIQREWKALETEHQRLGDWCSQLERRTKATSCQFASERAELEQEREDFKKDNRKVSDREEEWDKQAAAEAKLQQELSNKASDIARVEGNLKAREASLAKRTTDLAWQEEDLAFREEMWARWNKLLDELELEAEEKVKRLEGKVRALEGQVRQFQAA
eukprot:XP_008676080.1 neural cell adhesion molecule 1-A-like [Zea mays]